MEKADLPKNRFLIASSRSLRTPETHEFPKLPVVRTVRRLTCSFQNFPNVKAKPETRKDSGVTRFSTRRNPRKRTRSYFVTESTIGFTPANSPKNLWVRILSNFFLSTRKRRSPKNPNSCSPNLSAGTFPIRSRFWRNAVCCHKTPSCCYFVTKV